MVRSPVDSCFGMSPSQAAKSRPYLKPLPLPIAATTALETIGPTPGMLISRWQLASCFANASISLDTLAMRSSKRRQSCTSSLMRLSILGDSASDFELKISGSRDSAFLSARVLAALELVFDDRPIFDMHDPIGERHDTGIMRHHEYRARPIAGDLRPALA